MTDRGNNGLGTPELVEARRELNEGEAKLERMQRRLRKAEVGLVLTALLLVAVIATDAAGWAIWSFMVVGGISAWYSLWAGFFAER